MLSVLAICIGASLGALARWQLGLWLNPGGLIPWGTLTANLVGGYLIGVCVAVFQALPELDPVWRLALVTGFLIKWLGWRAAFAIPGLLCLACGVWFALVCPREGEAPAKRKGGAKVVLSPAAMARAFLVMTTAAVTASLLFNLTTNGNGQLITERFRGIIEDPATLGILLAAVYAVASIAQVVVGRLIDKYPLKKLYFWIVIGQIPLLFAAANAQGWTLFVLLTASMAFIFGAIPFTDAMIVRYVDDRLRSRVAGMRLAVSFSISSTAVWLLGPAVKGLGFNVVFMVMAGIAACTAAMVFLLPGEDTAGNVVKS